MFPLMLLGATPEARLRVAERIVERLRAGGVDVSLAASDAAQSEPARPVALFVDIGEFVGWSAERHERLRRAIVEGAVKLFLAGAAGDRNALSEAVADERLDAQLYYRLGGYFIDLDEAPDPAEAKKAKRAKAAKKKRP